MQYRALPQSFRIICLKTVESAEKCFQEQLSRLRTDYVDYYLMHMLSDIKSWERLKRIADTKFFADA